MKLIEASKLEALPRYVLDLYETLRTQHAILIPSENGEILLVKDLSALIEAAPESSEPVAKIVLTHGTGLLKGKRIPKVMLDAKYANLPNGTKLYTTQQDQTALIRELVNMLDEVNNWLVCAPISTPEDMAQNFEPLYDKINVLLTRAKEEIQ